MGIRELLAIKMLRDKLLQLPVIEPVIEALQKKALNFEVSSSNSKFTFDKD